MMSGRSRRVKVWLRVRPTDQFAHNMIDLVPEEKMVNIHMDKSDKRSVVNNQKTDWTFKVDGVLHNASQETVFDSTAAGIVQKAMDGYNGTILCYGQTGAGKTYSMSGTTENYKHRGIIPRALSQVYKEVNNRPDNTYLIRVSYMEIYNENMLDLLATLPESLPSDPANSPLTIVEDNEGIHVRGLGSHLAQTEEAALNYLFEGETNRAIAEHSLNSQSSRSHCIFTVYIESRSTVLSDSKYTVSKINFVDLAGSERLGKTKSQGKTQQEAMYINKSLSFLEQLVIALADKKRDFIPYRQSRLNYFLKDSIGGNCSTVMIANVWGEAAQIEETISTLRFANRMMCVAMDAMVNERHDPTLLLKKLQKEVSHLKHELAMHDTLNNRSKVTYEPLSEQQQAEIKQQVRRFADGELDEVDIVNVRQIQGVFDAFKALYKETEKEVEEKLREKYTLVDRLDPASIVAAQQAGAQITDDGELVGEPDGETYAVGVAPTSAKPSTSAVVASRKKKGSRSATGKILSPQPSQTQKDEREEAGSPGSAGVAEKRPSTPPGREESFEEFKRSLGSEIHRILIENKDILGNKKKAYADIARQINFIKSEIDKSRNRLDEMKIKREDEGLQTNESGEIVLTEEEFLEVQRLKDLKSSYRGDFDELSHLKAEIKYCERLVEQCRHRLIAEFDNWYAESFLSEGQDEPSGELGYGTQRGTTVPARGVTVLEDEQEKFERLQRELLMEDPDSASFYNAKMRTQQRKSDHVAMSQAQPAFRRKPGTPIRKQFEGPPSRLQVQY